jgi:RNA-directed DNA polymerase
MNNEPTTVEAAWQSQCPQDIRLAPWPRLQKLRTTLGQKAKQEKRWRFYSLYGHVIHPETLAAAWAMVKFNGGACGIDGVTITSLTESPEKEANFLAELQRELQAKTYQAQGVRRVYIPKANGKLRPLGIPTVRDRVVQCAVKLIIEPIYEEDFEECSFGFRPGRRAHQAIDTIHANLKAGRTAVYDADLASYFDTIPHDKLMLGLRERIVDGAMLGLIRQWLNAVVIEPPEKDERGQPKGGPKITRPKAGTPQGGVLSPLLANLHLHWFDQAFNGPKGPGTFAKAQLVRYADDFVVLSRYKSSRIREWIEHLIEVRLGLKINREKTSYHDVEQVGERLDFLGFSFRHDRDLHGRSWRYWNVFPSVGAVKRERAKLSEMTNHKQCFTPMRELIERVNRHLRAWAGYFDHGYPRAAFRCINRHVLERMSKNLRRRSQRGYKVPEGHTLFGHLQQLGLKSL